MKNLNEKAVANPNKKLISTLAANLKMEADSVKEPKKLIVVLGMHRSGTSAVARSMQALGVNLGNTLEPPVQGINDKGFFEDIEINRFNEDLLHAIGSDWQTLSLIPSTVFDQAYLAPLKLRAIDLLRRKIGHQSFGLKNPRFVKLFPFWKTVFNHLHISPSYVIVIRHPMSVAHSLKNRDGFESEKSYYLWLEHVLPSILQTTGTQRVIVDFDLLMTDPNSQLDRIAQSLELTFDPDSSDVKEFVSDFLDMGLRHTKFEFEDLHIDSAVPIDVVGVYELMMRLARDEINIDTQEVKEAFEQLAMRLQSLSPALNYMTGLEKKVVEYDNQITNLNQALAEVSSVYEQVSLENQLLVKQRDETLSLNGCLLEENQLLVKQRDETLSLNGCLLEENQLLVKQRDETLLLNVGLLEENQLLVKQRDEAQSLNERLSEENQLLIKRLETGLFGVMQRIAIMK